MVNSVTVRESKVQPEATKLVPVFCSCLLAVNDNWELTVTVVLATRVGWRESASYT